MLSIRLEHGGCSVEIEVPYDLRILIRLMINFGRNVIGLAMLYNIECCIIKKSYL